jgi:hypothetical protein
MYIYKTGISEIDGISRGLEAGTNILLLAPSMSSAEQLAYSLIKPVQGEYSIVLSTNERAAEVVDFFKSAGCNKKFVGVIDAITKSSTPGITDTPRLMFVSSPTDLTGIGIKFSNMIEAIFEGTFADGETGLFPPPIRFCVNSISTLLMYRKLEVLYQFLHILTAKQRKIEGVALYLLNNESFDDKTLSLIKQLMTGVIEVKVEGNDNFFRVLGLKGVTADWHKFTINKGQVTILP